MLTKQWRNAITGLVCFLLGSTWGCSQYETAAPSATKLDERITAWPKDWSGLVGQQVTLEGTAVNAKLGALLEGEKSDIWIDGLESWPEGFYSGGAQGKRLRVTGTVIINRKNDLPVFIQEPGGVVRAGIPVQSREEMEKEKWRYLLKDAKWTVLE